jgi:hypothetical protein
VSEPTADPPTGSTSEPTQQLGVEHTQQLPDPARTQEFAAEQSRTEEPAARQLTAEQLALVAEGCTRSAVVWLRPAGTGAHRLAWHAWHDGAVHVVSGGGEQDLPALDDIVEVVVPSKDARGRLATVEARAVHLVPGTSAWADAVQVLASKRLNDRNPEQQRDRWARDCTVTRLEPVAVLAAGGGPDDAPSGSVVPARSGSTTVRLPYHVGGRRRRRRQA